MGLFSNFKALRQFKGLKPRWRNIVVYSESGQDWHHFADIIEHLTGPLTRPVTYITSDSRDPGLRAANPLLKTFVIEEGFFRTWLFQTLDVDVLLLTMMDLNNLDLKRSLLPVYYLYLFHSMGSTHMVDFANSYDHYDGLLCVGPHHEAEIRAREQLEGLPEKELFQHGYRRLETLLEEAKTHNHRYQPGTTPSVLVAPTWGEDSLFNRCGEELIGALLDAGMHVIMRPHYHTLRLSPGVCERIADLFSSHERFEYIDQMGESDTLYRSHVLITDWSAIGIEYALGLEKPVLFIDLPRRIRNPDWEQLKLEPLESGIRDQVGAILAPSDVHDAPAAVTGLLERPANFAALREKMVYNLGRSTEAAAEVIVKVADRQAQARQQRETANG